MLLEKKINPQTGEPDVAGHLLHLLHGIAPDPVKKRAMEVSLIVYAEHDFNASTFAARVATSTLSDAYFAFTAAISTLRGPLHGNANYAVLRFVSKFSSPDEAEAAVREMLAKKARIPGFGQRAYSKGDPRNAINRALAKKLCDSAGVGSLCEVSARIENLLLQERKMFANLDCYTATIYNLCGLPATLFAPMFFLACISGLVAHIDEQRANNRLIHPSSSYVGPPPRPFEAIAQRSA